MKLRLGLQTIRPFSGQAGGGLFAPSLGYPSPLAANPSSIVVHFPVDWQSGDTFKLPYSSSVTMSPATILSHAITDTDITNGSFSFPLPTFAGINYLQGYGNHAGVDSLNKSGIVAWGDTTAPVITTAATASVYEQVKLAITLAATDTGGVPALVSDGTKPGWYISGGADQLQFQIGIVGGVPTLQWWNNGVQVYSSPANVPPNNANPYNVQVTAIDYGGNKSAAQSIAVTVNAISVAAFSFTNVGNAPLSTPEQSNTVTLSITPAGVSVPISISGAGFQYSKNGGAFTSANGTVQNGDTVQLQVTSSGSYSTAETGTLTVNSNTSANWSVTTMANPSAAGFTASSTQLAAINNAYGSAVWTFAGIDFVVGGKPVVFLFAHDANTFSSVVVKGAGASGADIALTQRLTNSAGQPMQVWTSDTAIVTGASQNVVVTATGNASYVGISTGTLTNVTSSVPSATGVANFGATSGGHVATPAITIPANGVGVGFFGLNSGGTYTAATGSLLSTKLNGADNGTNAAVIDQISSGSWTPQVNYTGGDAANGGLSCAWSH